MDLILVRHTTLAIEAGICYGQADVLPSEIFDVEAKVVAEKLKSFKPNKVFTSSLKRCTLLAEACGYKDAVLEPSILELDFGDWELIPWDKINDEYAQKWMNDYISIPTPNGESLQDMVNRIQLFLAELKKCEDEQILCFTHSGVIRVIDHLVNKKALEKMFDTPIEYGGVYHFNI